MFYKQINGVNIINYNPSARQMLENMVKSLEIKKRMEKLQVGVPSYTKEQKAQIGENWEEIVNSYDGVEQYLNLSKGQ